MMSKYKELVISFIRTSLVPPVAGYILTFLLDKGINIDATWVYTSVMFVLSGLWYVTLRAIELLAANPVVKKWAGIFLGYNSSPIYLEKPNTE